MGGASGRGSEHARCGARYRRRCPSALEGLRSMRRRKWEGPSGTPMAHDGASGVAYDR